MRNEINAAVQFLAIPLKNADVNSVTIEKFKSVCRDILQRRFYFFWMTNAPRRFSGYRSIRVLNDKIDQVITEAGEACGLSYETLYNIYNMNFILWINPNDVCFRIGDDSSIFNLAL